MPRFKFYPAGRVLRVTRLRPSASEPPLPSMGVRQRLLAATQRSVWTTLLIFGAGFAAVNYGGYHVVAEFLTYMPLHPYKELKTTRKECLVLGGADLDYGDLNVQPTEYPRGLSLPWFSRTFRGNLAIHSYTQLMSRSEAASMAIALWALGTRAGYSRMLANPTIDGGMKARYWVHHLASPLLSPLRCTWKGYAYDYLPEKYIRLVEIKPGGENDVIQLHIYSTFFRPATKKWDLTLHTPYFPSYTALSYEWLDQDDPIVVEIGDLISPLADMPIGRNLHAFLHELRIRGELGPFWFDKICIDQKDEAEKQIQLGIMDEIYKNAEEVIAWLGNEEGYDFDAAKEVLSAFRKPGSSGKWQGWTSEEVMDRVVEHQDHNLNWRPGLGNILRQGQPEDVLREKFKMTKDYDNGWKAVKNLFERSYFQRSWIIQELVLTRKHRLMIGRHDVTDMWEAVVTLHQNPRLEGLISPCLLASPEALPRLTNLESAMKNYRHGRKLIWRNSRRTRVISWHGFELGALCSRHSEARRRPCPKTRWLA